MRVPNGSGWIEASVVAALVDLNSVLNSTQRQGSFSPPTSASALPTDLIVSSVRQGSSRSPSAASGRLFFSRWSPSRRTQEPSSGSETSKFWARAGPVRIRGRIQAAPDANADNLPTDSSPAPLSTPMPEAGGEIHFGSDRRPAEADHLEGIAHPAIVGVDGPLGEPEGSLTASATKFSERGSACGGLGGGGLFRLGRAWFFTRFG